MSYSKKQMLAVIGALGEVGHVFSEAEGRELVSSLLDKKVSDRKALFPLPWCGVVSEGDCVGLRWNHGLMSQCSNKCDTGLCKTCLKGADSDGRARYGLVSDRVSWMAEHPDSPFRNHGGKCCKSLGSVLSKLGVSREDAEAEAESKGLTIPDSEWELRSALKGRPRKNPSASSSSSSDEDKPKRGRGRPRKLAKKVAGGVGDDLISALVLQATLDVDGHFDGIVLEEELHVSKDSSADKISLDVAKSPTVGDLKAKCKAAGLKVGGTKSVLQARLTDHASGLFEPGVVSVAVSEVSKAVSKDAKSPTVADLKAKCKAAGLKVGGNKAELLARLAAGAPNASSEPVVEVKSEPVVELKSEPVVEVKSEPVVELKSEPVVELKSEPVVVSEEVLTDELQESDDEEELSVTKWICPVDDVEYLKSEDDQVFDVDTQEEVGRWDGEKIVAVDDDDS